MMNKLKVAFFGMAHPHAGMLRKTLALHTDEVEFLGAADVPPVDDQPYAARLRNLGNATDIADLRIFDDWRELAAKMPDLAVVMSDNRSRGDICCGLLSQKIPTLDEKPMAMDYADAVKIAECAQKNDTPFLTNWPIAWVPAFRIAKELAGSGRIGKVMRVTYRSPATWGPYNLTKPTEEKAASWWYRHDRGGGAFLDYACYGTMLATWIFGKRAERVCAMTKNFTAGFSDAEDYSSMMLDFGDGVGLLEGSWLTFNCGQVPSGPVIYGTEGTIVCDRYSNLVKVYVGAEHRPVEPSEVIDAEADRQLDLLGANLIAFLRGKESINEMLTPGINLDVCAALDAGRKSVKSGGFVQTEI